MARKAPGYRAAREMAVVATPLITIFPAGPYDQEIKSLLLYQLRRSVFSPAISPGRTGRAPPAGVERTTNGLTVRRSTAEAERTALGPATPGVTGRYSIAPSRCSWVQTPLSPPNEPGIGRLGRTSPFHGGNTLTARGDRVIPAPGFESHPLRVAEREGFEPSKVTGPIRSSINPW
jgi:hypothetical protein